MMQSEILLPSWPFQDNMDSSLDQLDQYGLEFSPSFILKEDSAFSMMFPDENFTFSDFNDQQMGFQELDLEGFDPISVGVEEFRSLVESEGRLSIPSEQFSSPGECLCSPTSSIRSSESSMDMTPMQLPLTLPVEGMEIDNQSSILHLLQAYGEAIENSQEELAGVILSCLRQKASPFGKTWERVAFNLSQEIQNQGDYLKQESIKNFEVALRAFYQMLPYTRFAHFAANSVILEAIPDDAPALHIIDFDIGGAVQWPPMIEAISQQHRTLRITSMRWDEEENSAPSPWRFEEVRRQLCHHVRCSNLKLNVDEMGMEEVVAELKRVKKRGGGGREFLAFNCMTALPPMGKGKSRKLVREFLTVAKGLLANSGNYISRNRGIITFGGGDACEKLKNCHGFGAFSDGYLGHYRAILESMDTHFPGQLKEARMTMQCQFVAPNISSHALFQKWEEMKEDRHFQEGMGMKSVGISHGDIDGS